MKLIILVFCILEFGITHGHNTCNCPATSSSSKVCPKDWNFPQINYQGTIMEDETCNVSFDWNWNLKNANPSLHFDCRYSNGKSCNNEHSITCGSCQNFNISGINVDLNPVIDYSDECGNKFQLLLRDICLRKPTFNSLSDSSSDYYCPPFTQCTGCPSNFGIPLFHLHGSPVTSSLCNLTISWNWQYNSSVSDNPNLLFTCIYAANGKYCENTKSVCASCRNVTFSNLDMTLDPYLDYTDTCSNIGQYILEDCGDYSLPQLTTKHATQHTTLPSTVLTTEKVTIQTTQKTNGPTLQQTTQHTTLQTTKEPTHHTTTTKQTTQLLTTPPHHCTRICNGCPHNFDVPFFHQHGVVLENNECNIHLTWDYPEHEGEEVNMKFECIYDEGDDDDDNRHCQPNNENVCGSCEEFLIQNVKVHDNPYIHYTDSCGNKESFSVTNECNQKPTTEKTSTLPYHCTRICNGCPHNFDVPFFHQQGEVLENDHCNLHLTWVYPEHEGEEVNMKFECIYDNGNHCQPDDEHACGTCEKFLIQNIKMYEGPYIHYTDSCGNRESFSVTSQCN